MRCIIIPSCDHCPNISYTYGETSCKKMNYTVIPHEKGSTSPVAVPVWCPLPMLPGMEKPNNSWDQ